MGNSNRERDLVLAPNEYAYISDQTKGHIVAYVGPFKTSLANTDQPVFFDMADKSFKACTLETSRKNFTTVPEGWYVMLKNPAKDDVQPAAGTANNLPNLDVGRKVNLPGPAFFALWPGQMVRVIKGHRLRSNQYLLVRVYEEAQARSNWKKAVIMPQKLKAGEEAKTEDDDIKEVIPDSEVPNLSVGKLLVIKGMNVSFYIPPTGIEVIPDINGNYVRQAVTLERLEYCILLDEDGNKRYIQGPDVVIPEPTETFFVKNGQRKFKAIELSEISGIYVKVISPYTENDKEYKVGDELFITGKEQMIYFPRPEHALIKDGEQEIYYAVAIPPGEGRYYLNRKNGQILLEKGPCMFLPDPREAVIVQRILTPKQAKLWYPGNEDVVEYNKQLSEVAKRTKKDSSEYYVPTNQLQQLNNLEEIQDQKEVMAEIASDEFVRSQTYTKARTITLDTRFQGAVTVDVWTGYAVLVTGRSGTRKVIVGPQTYLLEYDESLAVNELSTGRPKTDDNLIKTVYLRVLHNKVSDIVEVETRDLCPVAITLSYRVNFTGEPEKWFNVENYVKFLTDHLRSKIRNLVQKISIIEFYSNGINILRDIILGKPGEDGTRSGGKFEENGMHIYDVEVLDIELLDEAIEEILFHAQHEEVKQKLEVASKQHFLEYTQKTEEISRQIGQEKATTVQQQLQLQQQQIEKELTVKLSEIAAEIKQAQQKLTAQLNEQEQLNAIQKNELQRENAKNESRIAHQKNLLQLQLAELDAEVKAIVSKAEAVSPDLIAALQAFGDKALAERMAESMAPLSILGGKSIADIFSNMLKGTVLENVLSKNALTEGEADEE